MDNTKPKDHVDEFKVNKWMLKHGFIWDITPGTPESPDPWNGLWNKDGNAFTQEQAVFLYRAWHPKRWWKFWV